MLNTPARRRSDAGFTLIELLIVIVILGVLAAIVVFSVKGITSKGELAACKADVETVTTAEEANYAQNGSYDTIANLVANGFLHAAPSSTKYTVSVNATTGAVTTNKDSAGPPVVTCGQLS